MKGSNPAFPWCNCRRSGGGPLSSYRTSRLEARPIAAQVGQPKDIGFGGNCIPQVMHRSAAAVPTWLLDHIQLMLGRGEQFHTVRGDERRIFHLQPPYSQDVIGGLNIDNVSFSKSSVVTRPK